MEENTQQEESIDQVNVIKTEDKVIPVAPTQEQLTMEQQRKFFTLVKHGALFLKFIRADINKQKDKYMNRTQRRRFEKEISEAIFSKELIEVYSAKVDQIIGFIDEAMNPKPKEEVKEVDGVEFLNNAQRLASEGKLNEDGSEKVVEQKENV